MNKLFKLLSSLILVFVLGIQPVYAYTNTNATIVYNTKTLDLGDKKCVTENGSIYIPLRVFSEQLDYNVDWNAEQKVVRIYDNINDIYLYTSGKTVVNGVESTSDKKPLIANGTTYVPLRFVSETLGIGVEWKSAEKKVVMTGRPIYGIENTNNLVAYTKTGKTTVAKLSGTPSINLVNHTKYSDVVNTSYTESGAITRTVNKQMYIRNGALIYDTYYTSEVRNLYTNKDSGVRYYDNYVAFLTSNDKFEHLIKIYDDTTGTLTKTINTNTEYNDVLNIQAVGDGFVVVNMLLEGESVTGGSYMDKHFMTTVIETKTGKVTPIYKNTASPNSYLAIANNSSMYINSGSVPTDGIYVSSKSGNVLNFVCNPSSSERIKYQFTLGQ